MCNRQGISRDRKGYFGSITSDERFPMEIAGHPLRCQVAIYSIPIVRINKDNLTVEEDTIIEDIVDFAQFVEEELPEGEPRYIAYTCIIPLTFHLDHLLIIVLRLLSTEFETKDGRKTYPLVFIYFAPPTSIAMNTLYASTKNRLVNALQILKARPLLYLSYIRNIFHSILI